MKHLNIKTVGCFETLLNNRLVLEFLQGVNWNSEHDKKRKVDIKVTCIENGVTQVRLVEKILL